MNLSPWELLIVLGIVLLVFGPKRLPSLGRQLGRGMREFKDSISGDRRDDRDEDDEERPALAPAAAEPASAAAGDAETAERAERVERPAP